MSGGKNPTNIYFRFTSSINYVTNQPYDFGTQRLSAILMRTLESSLSLERNLREVISFSFKKKNLKLEASLIWNKWKGLEVHSKLEDKMN